MGGSVSVKETSFPCDVSICVGAEVAGQRLCQLLSTFIQIFVYSCVLTTVDS